ncbi:uncharacterized protein [Panulirus ornatus]|uniref:uncharacterized protein isoform X3 n=1 Tax=Panulirus ornatus TaxID=150431 RepID=UPI003A8C2815
MEWKGIWTYVGNLIPGKARPDKCLEEEEEFLDVPEGEEQGLGTVTRRRRRTLVWDEDAGGGVGAASAEGSCPPGSLTEARGQDETRATSDDDTDDGGDQDDEEVVQVEEEGAQGENDGCDEDVDGGALSSSQTSSDFEVSDEVDTEIENNVVDESSFEIWGEVQLGGRASRVCPAATADVGGGGGQAAAALTAGGGRRGVTAGAEDTDTTAGAEEADTTPGAKETDTTGGTEETDNTGVSEKTDTTGVTEDTDTTGVTEETDTTGVTEDTDTTGVTEETDTTGVTEETNTTSVTEETDATGVTEDTDTTGVTEETDTTGVTEETDTTGVTEETDTTGVTEETDATGVTEDTDTTGVAEETDTTGVTEETDTTVSEERAEVTGSEGEGIDATGGEEQTDATGGAEEETEATDFAFEGMDTTSDGGEATDSTDSEATDATGSEVTDPTGSEATNPTVSEVTDATGSEATDVTGSEATDPTVSEATDTTGSEATDVTGSEATDPTGSEATDATGSEATDATGSEATDATGSEATDATGSEATDATGSEATDVTGSVEEGTDTGGEEDTDITGDGDEGTDTNDSDGERTDTTGDRVGKDTATVEGEGTDTTGDRVGKDTATVEGKGTDTTGDRVGKETATVEGEGTDTTTGGEGTETIGRDERTDTTSVDGERTDAIVGGEGTKAISGGEETDTAGSGGEETETTSGGEETNIAGSGGEGTDITGGVGKGTDTAGSGGEGTDTAGSVGEGTDTAGSVGEGIDTAGTGDEGTDNVGGDGEGTDTTGRDGEDTDTISSGLEGTDTTGGDGEGTDTTGGDGEGTDTTGGGGEGTDTTGGGGEGTDTTGGGGEGTDTVGWDGGGMSTTDGVTAGTEVTGGEEERDMGVLREQEARLPSGIEDTRCGVSVARKEVSWARDGSLGTGSEEPSGPRGGRRATEEGIKEVQCPYILLSWRLPPGTAYLGYGLSKETESEDISTGKDTQGDVREAASSVDEEANEGREVGTRSTTVCEESDDQDRREDAEEDGQPAKDPTQFLRRESEEKAPAKEAVCGDVAEDWEGDEDDIKRRDDKLTEDKECDTEEKDTGERNRQETHESHAQTEGRPRGGYFGTRRVFLRKDEPLGRVEGFTEDGFHRYSKDVEAASKENLELMLKTAVGEVAQPKEKERLGQDTGGLPPTFLDGAEAGQPGGGAVGDVTHDNNANIENKDDEKHEDSGGCDGLVRDIQVSLEPRLADNSLLTAARDHLDADAHHEQVDDTRIHFDVQKTREDPRDVDKSYLERQSLDSGSPSEGRTTQLETPWDARPKKQTMVAQFSDVAKQIMKEVQDSRSRRNKCLRDLRSLKPRTRFPMSKKYKDKSSPVGWTKPPFSRDHDEDVERRVCPEPDPPLQVGSQGTEVSLSSSKSKIPTSGHSSPPATECDAGGSIYSSIEFYEAFQKSQPVQMSPNFSSPTGRFRRSLVLDDNRKMTEDVPEVPTVVTSHLWLADIGASHPQETHEERSITKEAKESRGELSLTRRSVTDQVLVPPTSETVLHVDSVKIDSRASPVVLQVLEEPPGCGSITPSTVVAGEAQKPDSRDPKRVEGGGQHQYSAETGRVRVLSSRAARLPQLGDESKHTSDGLQEVVADTGDSVRGSSDGKDKTSKDKKEVEDDNTVVVRDSGAAGLVAEEGEDINTATKEASRAEEQTAHSSSYSKVCEASAVVFTQDSVHSSLLSADDIARTTQTQSSPETVPSKPNGVDSSPEILDNAANENRENRNKPLRWNEGGDGSNGTNNREINVSIRTRYSGELKTSVSNSSSEDGDLENLEGPWTSPQLARVVQELVVSKKFNMTSAQAKKRQNNISRLDVPQKDRTLIFDSSKLSKTKSEKNEGLSQLGAHEDKRTSQTQEEALRGVTKGLPRKSSRRGGRSMDYSGPSRLSRKKRETNGQSVEGRNPEASDKRTNSGNDSPPTDSEVGPGNGALAAREFQRPFTKHSSDRGSKGDSKRGGGPREKYLKSSTDSRRTEAMRGSSESRLRSASKVERPCRSPQPQRGRSVGGLAREVSPRQSPVISRRQVSPRASPQLGSPRLGPPRAVSPKMTTKRLSPKLDSPRSGGSPRTSPTARSPKLGSPRIVKPIVIQGRRSPRLSPGPDQHHANPDHQDMTGVTSLSDVLPAGEENDLEITEGVAGVKIFVNGHSPESLRKMRETGSPDEEATAWSGVELNFPESKMDYLTVEGTTLTENVACPSDDGGKSQSPEGEDLREDTEGRSETPASESVEPFTGLQRQTSDPLQSFDTFMEKKASQDQRQQRYVYMASKISGKLDSEIIQFFESQQQRPREIARNEKVIPEHFRGSSRSSTRKSSLQPYLEKTISPRDNTSGAEETRYFENSFELKKSSTSIDLRLKKDDASEEVVQDKKEGSVKSESENVFQDSEILNIREDSSVFRDFPPGWKDKTGGSEGLVESEPSVGRCGQGVEVGGGEEGQVESPVTRVASYGHTSQPEGPSDQARAVGVIPDDGNWRSNGVMDPKTGGEERYVATQRVTRDWKTKNEKTEAEVKMAEKTRESYGPEALRSSRESPSSSTDRRDEMIARFKQDDGMMIEKIRSLKGSSTRHERQVDVAAARLDEQAREKICAGLRLSLAESQSDETEHEEARRDWGRDGNQLELRDATQAFEIEKEDKSPSVRDAILEQKSVSEGGGKMDDSVVECLEKIREGQPATGRIAVVRDAISSPRPGIEPASLSGSRETNMQGDLLGEVTSWSSRECVTESRVRLDSQHKSSLTELIVSDADLTLPSTDHPPTDPDKDPGCVDPSPDHALTDLSTDGVLVDLTAAPLRTRDLQTDRVLTDPSIDHTQVDVTTDPGLVGTTTDPGLVGTIIGPCIVATSTDPDLVGTSTDPDLAGTNTDPDLVGTSTDPDLVGTSTDPGLVDSNTDPDLVGTRTDPGLVDTSTDPGLVGTSIDPGLIDTSTDPGLVGTSTDSDLVVTRTDPGLVDSSIDHIPSIDLGFVDTNTDLGLADTSTDLGLVEAITDTSLADRSSDSTLTDPGTDQFLAEPELGASLTQLTEAEFGKTEVAALATDADQALPEGKTSVQTTPLELTPRANETEHDSELRQSETSLTSIGTDASEIREVKRYAKESLTVQLTLVKSNVDLRDIGNNSAPEIRRSIVVTGSEAGSTDTLTGEETEGASGKDEDSHRKVWEDVSDAGVDRGTPEDTGTGSVWPESCTDGDNVSMQSDSLLLPGAGQSSEAPAVASDDGRELCEKQELSSDGREVGSTADMRTDAPSESCEQRVDASDERDRSATTRRLMSGHRRLTKTISEGNFTQADEDGPDSQEKLAKLPSPPSLQRSQTEGDFHPDTLVAAASSISRSSTVSEIFARGVYGRIRMKSRSVENIRLSSLSTVEITSAIDTPPLPRAGASPCRIVGVLKKKDSRDSVSGPTVTSSSQSQQALHEGGAKDNQDLRKDPSHVSKADKKTGDQTFESSEAGATNRPTQPLESLGKDCTRLTTETVKGRLSVVDASVMETHIYENVPQVMFRRSIGDLKVASQQAEAEEEHSLSAAELRKLVPKVVHIYENLQAAAVAGTTLTPSVTAGRVREPKQVQEDVAAKEVAPGKGLADREEPGDVKDSPVPTSQPAAELSIPKRSAYEKSSLRRRQQPESESRTEKQKSNYMKQKTARVGILKKQKSDITGVRLQKLHYFDNELPGERRRSYSISGGVPKKSPVPQRGVSEAEKGSGVAVKQVSLSSEPATKVESSEVDRRCHSSISASSGTSRSSTIDRILQSCAPCISSNTTSTLDLSAASSDHANGSRGDATQRGRDADDAVFSDSVPYVGHGSLSRRQQARTRCPYKTSYSTSDVTAVLGSASPSSMARDPPVEGLSVLKDSSKDLTVKSGHTELKGAVKEAEQESEITQAPVSEQSSSSLVSSPVADCTTTVTPSDTYYTGDEATISSEQETGETSYVSFEKESSTPTPEQGCKGKDDTDFYSELLDTILSVVDAQEPSFSAEAETPIPASSVAPEPPVQAQQHITNQETSQTRAVELPQQDPADQPIETTTEQEPESMAKDCLEHPVGSSDSDSTSSVDSELAEVRRRVSERFPPVPRADPQASQESVIASPSAVCPMPNCAACRSHSINFSQPLVFTFDEPVTSAMAVCEPARAASLPYVDHTHDRAVHDLLSRSASLPHEAEAYHSTQGVCRTDDDEYWSVGEEDAGRGDAKLHGAKRPCQSSSLHDASPRDLTLLDSSQKDSSSQETSPKDSTSQESSPKDSTSQESSPKDSTSQESSQKDSMFQDSSSKDSSSQEASPKDSLPQDSPQDGMSQEDPQTDSGLECCRDHSESSSNQLVEELSQLRLENEKLSARNRSLQSEVEELRRVKENIAEEDLQLKPRINEMTIELTHAKEALSALKADRKRLKAEKFDLLNQMKQLYATLEDKEKELRDFIRNYEQRMKESDESLRHLAAERDETEREKWNILKHARDESERVVKLSAQLGLKEATVKKLQEELDMVRKQLTSVGYYSDAESVRTNGLTTPTASTPACSPLPVSTPTPTPNGRGSSADSGVRLSSDRDSTASHDGTLTITVERGSLDCDTLSVCSSATAVSQYYYYACGPGTPKESPSLSPLYATPVSLRGEDQGGENITPSGAPTPTAASINSSAISGLANSSASTGGLSRSAEQLCERLSEAAESSKLRGSFTLTRKSHKGGGTWGSISRVFARQKKRAALDASLYDGNGSDKRASWSPSSSLCASPLTEESYSEKLRLLEEAQHIPLERWKAPTVLAWLEVTLGMPQYGAMCAENVRSGKVLLELSDSELEAGLGITHPMHRKKLRLAIEELREPRLTRFPRISTLGHTWVSSEWLPDLGLPQYSETFANNLVDGRLLEALTKKELEKHLGVHRKFHQASVIHGVHLLRIVRFDRQVLAERRRQSDHIDTDPVVWTNMRWIRWARSIDLAEYADNLKDSGVHGALVVLESSFTADTMATALGIPQSKNIIRRHLATELESLVNPARQQLDEQARYAKMERRRQEKLASGGSLGRSFSRSYGTGLEKGEKDKRRSSLRGSLSRALGLRLREETATGGNNGGESSSSGGQSPAVTTRTHVHHAPHARPRSSIMPSAAYVHHETHRRVKSIGDIETITVTPV